MENTIKYKVNSNISIIHVDSQEIILNNMTKGKEYNINLEVYNLLLSFNIPVNIEQAKSIYKFYSKNELANDSFVETVQALISNEIIVPIGLDIDTERNSVINSNNRFFNFSGMKVEDVINVGGKIPDTVAILGMPFDLNVTNLPGTRRGPEYLRYHSRSIVPYGFPKTRIKSLNYEKINLESRVFDCGDISDVVFDRNGRQQKQLEEVIKKLTLAKIRPIIIGGDHSITYSSLKGILSHKKIGLIHIDAHYDGGNKKQINFEDIHHGNFIDGFIEDKNLKHILQIGQRQKKDQYHIQPPNIEVVPLESLDISSYLKKDLSYFISLDVDVLDPAFMSSTGTPVPLGLQPKELFQILDSLKNEKIIGGDIVEFIPREDKVHEALLVNEILLKFISIFAKEELS